MSGRMAGERASANPMNFARDILLLLLRGYKWAVSPMLLPACRYVPTCSEYAMEAVDRYGAVHGGVMAIWRVLRCHPFAKGGIDPVVRTKTSGAPGPHSRETELCSH